MTQPQPAAATTANPLLGDWTGPYGLPPFREVRPEHFAPAFEVAMRGQLAEVDAIASQPEPPTFHNTVQAFDRCGRLYTRIDLLFHNLCASETSPALQAVQREMAPRLAAHENAIAMHQGLFARIDSLHRRRHELGLDDENLRQQEFDLDDAQFKPYFVLDNMIAAMFDVAGRLFGLSFAEQPDPPLYHPDVRLWEVRNRDGQPIGVFLGDNFARPTKRSGAWMTVYRSQSEIDGGTLPIVANNNFAKADPALLSFDDVRTLFHEFGHGLHGLLSQVRHERLSGTRVLRDFVERPSQLFENWALEPQVLPAALRDRPETLLPARLKRAKAAPRLRRPARSV